MTMATETSQRQDSRCSNKGAVLRKQSEIEEDEQDTSPGSDKSDATITPGDKLESLHGQASGGGSPEYYQTDHCHAEVHISDSSPSNHTQATQKIKQLQRGTAFEESPPPEQHVINSEGSTNGLEAKLQSSPRERLQKSGSQSSEAGTSSSLSRDSSFDTSPYKDSTGINLEDFIHKTINKSPKDRNMLLKLETDLINFINEPKHHYLKFPQMSSYDRMLVHRIAAFFGLDHNVDQTGKCVIVNKTSNKRIPDFSFREQIDNLDGTEKKPKMIMKRGGKSLDEKDSYSKNLDKPQLANTKARSFEERRKVYERVRSKIFNSCDEECSQQPMPYTVEEANNVISNIIKKPQRPSSFSKNPDGQPWSSTESSGYGTDCSSKSRGIPKANSFGGITAHNHHIKTPSKSQSLCKADSLSSGTASPGMPRHVTAIPTPPGSRTDSSPLSRSSSTGPVQSPLHQSPGFLPGPGHNQQVLWVSSDYRNIPPGSVIINPETGQPYSNPDGSIYTHNPNQSTPIPQQPNMFTSPQYQTELWTPSSEQGTEQLCRHLSMVSLSQQSSLDSVGEPPGTGTVQGGTQYIIGPQPQPQIPQTGFSQQSAQVGQPQFYQGPQNMVGQAGVRYVFPVNNFQGQGQPSMALDNQNQTFPQNASQQFSTNQYGPNYNSFPVAANQTGDNFANLSQNTYPVAHNDNLQPFSSFPVQYSQNNFGQNPSQVFYTSAQPTAGYSFGSNQGPYHTGTTPPSQQAPSANVSIQSIGQPLNVGQTPTGGAVQSPSTPQFMYQTVTHYQQPRVSNPQLVQLQSIQPHNINMNPTGAPQTIPMIRNMQMNMQITPSQGIPPQQGGVPPQQGQVTVSAKGFPLDNQMPKIESGGDSKEYLLGGVGSYGSPMVAGPPRHVGQMYRPPTQLSTDVRLVGQSTFKPPIQQMVINPQQTTTLQPQKPAQTTTNSNQSSKSHLVKSRSKDGSDTSSSQSNENQTGNILEVLDLPRTMDKTEVKTMLNDLLVNGVQIQFIPHDSRLKDNSAMNMSHYKKVLVVFPDSSSANQTIQSCNSNCSRYKFKVYHGESI